MTQNPETKNLIIAITQSLQSKSPIPGSQQSIQTYIPYLYSQCKPEAKLYSNCMKTKLKAIKKGVCQDEMTKFMACIDLARKKA